MLLNEFLKEHNKVEEQNAKLDRQGDMIQKKQATIADLKLTVDPQPKEMEALIA